MTATTGQFIADPAQPIPHCPRWCRNGHHHGDEIHRFTSALPLPRIAAWHRDPTMATVGIEAEPGDSHPSLLVDAPAALAPCDARALGFMLLRLADMAEPQCT